MQICWGSYQLGVKEFRYLRTGYKFKDITCNFFIWFSNYSLPESDKIVVIKGICSPSTAILPALWWELKLFHQGSLRRYSGPLGTRVINSTLEIVPVPDYLPSAVGALAIMKCICWPHYTLASLSLQCFQCQECSFNDHGRHFVKPGKWCWRLHCLCLHCLKLSLCQDLPTCFLRKEFISHIWRG